MEGERRLPNTFSRLGGDAAQPPAPVARQKTNKRCTCSYHLINLTWPHIILTSCDPTRGECLHPAQTRHTAMAEGKCSSPAPPSVRRRSRLQTGAVNLSRYRAMWLPAPGR